MLNRRSLLTSGALSAIAFGIPIGPIKAGVHGVGSPNIPSFLGNPNVTISAISTVGGIVCSRTSGNTPCFVQVSASAITATGTSVPFEDLDFRWAFGDSAGTETFSNPGIGGGIVNANNGQASGEAAYVYRSAGTYIVTLTITGKNGSGFTTATVTQTITVSAFNPSGGEYWADSTAGGTNAGTLANPFNTIGAINTAIGTGSSKTLHIKRGSLFTGTTGLLPWENAGAGALTGLRIDDKDGSGGTYGSGAFPQIDVSSGSGNPFHMFNSTPTSKSDIVVSNILFTTSGTNSLSGNAAVNVLAQTGKTISDIYFDNVSVTMNYDGSSPATDQNNMTVQQQGQVGTLVNWGFWNVTLSGPATVGASINTIGLFTSGTNWMFFVAGPISGGTGSATPTLNHHIYPDCKQHSLYQWINFGVGAFRNYCINTNWNGAQAPLEFCEWLCFSQNNFSGVQRAHDMGNHNNDSTEVQYRNVVCQLNRINGLTGDGVLLFSNGISYTHRYNQVWNCNGGRYYAPDVTQLGSLLVSRIYFNKIYHDATVIGGNIISLGSASFTQLQTITDNAIEDLRSTALINALSFTSQAGATVNRNQYYFPNSTNALSNVAASVSFATWQNTGGFDAAGSVTNPNWINPANGIF